ncbi:class I SAM-dependent methyltransferase [Actinophytocola sediminis]
MTWPDIRHTYDVVAADYADTFADELSGKPFDRDLLDAFADAVAQPASGRVLGPILDVGCGPAGHVTRYLADRLDQTVVRVEGIDLSPVAVGEARRRNPDLLFWVGDLRELPANDQALAGIVAFYSVVHLPRAEWPAAFAELRRALVPGGLLLVAVHGGAGETGVNGWFGHDVSIRTTLVDLHELTAMVTAAGLTVLERHQRPPYPGEYPSPRLYLLAEKQ